MTLIVFSKGVYKSCNKQEIAYLQKNIREMVDEMEVTKNPTFFPWPASPEELERHKDQQVEVTFFPIHPGNLNRMVMILPLFVKDDNQGNTWYVQMKDEFGKIELDIRTPLNEGHHRVVRKKQ